MSLADKIAEHETAIGFLVTNGQNRLAEDFVVSITRDYYNRKEHEPTQEKSSRELPPLDPREYGGHGTDLRTGYEDWDDEFNGYYLLTIQEIEDKEYHWCVSTAKKNSGKKIVVASGIALTLEEAGLNIRNTCWGLNAEHPS